MFSRHLRGFNLGSKRGFPFCTMLFGNKSVLYKAPHHSAKRQAARPKAQGTNAKDPVPWHLAGRKMLAIHVKQNSIHRLAAQKKKNAWTSDESESTTGAQKLHCKGKEGIWKTALSLNQVPKINKPKTFGIINTLKYISSVFKKYYSV